MSIKASKFEDNYQWLEKDDDPEVKAWSDPQNQTDARLHRQVTGPSRDRETINRVVCENFAELFWARLAAGDFVRDEVSAAEAATDAGDTLLQRTI